MYILGSMGLKKESVVEQMPGSQKLRAKAPFGLYYLIILIFDKPLKKLISPLL